MTQEEINNWVEDMTQEEMNDWVEEFEDMLNNLKAPHKTRLEMTEYIANIFTENYENILDYQDNLIEEITNKYKTKDKKELKEIMNKKIEESKIRENIDNWIRVEKILRQRREYLGRYNKKEMYNMCAMIKSIDEILGE